jgi:hypothetical protein
LSLRPESPPSLAFNAFALQIVFNPKRIYRTDSTILARPSRGFLRTVVIWALRDLKNPNAVALEPNLPRQNKSNEQLEADKRAAAWPQTHATAYSGDELKRILENAPHIDLIFELPKVFEATPIIRDTQISVVNTRDSIAYDVKIEDKESSLYKATFEVIARVEKGHPKLVVMDLRRKPNGTYHRDFEALLKLEFEELQSIDEFTVRVPLTVRFYDSQRNLFQTRHEVVYQTYLDEASTHLIEGTRLVSEPLTSDQTKTYEIRFDYLPANMLDSGWVRAYPKDTDVKPKTTVASDASFPGSVVIDAPNGHAYDHHLSRNAKLSDQLIFAAKYTPTTMIFTEVQLSSKDGSQTVHKWIKYEPGNGSPHPTNGCEDYEYTYPIQGVPLQSEWRKFTISLPEVVAQTWGKHGLTFRGITVFRVRGSLSISPIEFYESRDPAF